MRGAEPGKRQGGDKELEEHQDRCLEGGQTCQLLRSRSQQGAVRTPHPGLEGCSHYFTHLPPVSSFLPFGNDEHMRAHQKVLRVSVNTPGHTANQSTFLSEKKPMKFSALFYSVTPSPEVCGGVCPQSYMLREFICPILKRSPSSLYLLYRSIFFYLLST